MSRRDGRRYGGKRRGGQYRQCADTHKPFRFTTCAGHEVAIAGGNCLSVDQRRYDIVIGLDRGFEPDGERAAPWAESVSYLFNVPNMGVPADVDAFRALVGYLAAQLLAGRSVFVGCIGGHGRTGLVLAAVYQRLTGEDDAINYTRAKYCRDAVESAEQIAWLVKHFGMVTAQPTRKPVLSVPPSERSPLTLAEYAEGHRAGWQPFDDIGAGYGWDDPDADEAEEGEEYDFDPDTDPALGASPAERTPRPEPREHLRLPSDSVSKTRIPDVWGLPDISGHRRADDTGDRPKRGGGGKGRKGGGKRA